MKILMLIDSLRVGGAETHVETLAAELTRTGHRVVIASSGGKIAEKLKKQGVKHLSLPNISGRNDGCADVQVPLALRVSAARELISHYIAREHPDMVHAHTRRTALLAAGACKKYNLPLVTTAHAMFSMDFPRNLISEWGDGTIAVSEDIKNHLIKHSQVATDKILVIENGVRLLPENEKAHTAVFDSQQNAQSSTPASKTKFERPSEIDKYFKGNDGVPEASKRGFAGARGWSLCRPTLAPPLSQNSAGATIANQQQIEKFAQPSRLSAKTVEVGVHDDTSKTDNSTKASPEIFDASRKIVFVSRLDGDCSLAAHLLCAVAPRLAQKYPDLEITIVGGGSEYPEILRKSLEINFEINRKLINVVGGADDPALYFDEGTLFVGVSRAALEAMAHGMAAILLGDEGYLGLLDDNNLAIAQNSNFTCRGARSLSDESEFLNEICKYFDMPGEERAHICAFSKSVVKNNYSAKKMARKTLAFYKSIVQRVKRERGEPLFPSKRVVLCGYYGRGNFGDEAILSSIKKRIGEGSCKTEITVLTDKNIVKNVKKMAGADLFIFGGGSLLQNLTSNASLAYYLSVICFSNHICRNTIMLANGIGPIVEGRCGFSAMPIVAHVIDGFDLISVRDNTSRALLKYFLPHRKVLLIPDPALIGARKINQGLINCELSESDERFFVFNLCSRGVKVNDDKDLSDIARVLKEIEKRFCAKVKLFVLNEREDGGTARKLSELLNNAEIIVPRSERDLMMEVRGACFALCQRYHGALFCVVCGVPTVTISADPKMRSFCKDFYLPSPCLSDILYNENILSDKISETQEHFLNHFFEINKKIESSTRLSSQAINTILKKYL